MLVSKEQREREIASVQPRVWGAGETFECKLCHKKKYYSMVSTRPGCCRWCMGE